MKIKYLGPRESVEVAGIGKHHKDHVEEYPDKLGMELIKTSKKNKWEVVEGPKKQPAHGDKKKAKEKPAKGAD